MNYGKSRKLKSAENRSKGKNIKNNFLENAGLKNLYRC